MNTQDVTRLNQEAIVHDGIDALGYVLSAEPQKLQVNSFVGNH